MPEDYGRSESHLVSCMLYLLIAKYFLYRNIQNARALPDYRRPPQGRRGTPEGGRTYNGPLKGVVAHSRFTSSDLSGDFKAGTIKGLALFPRQGTTS